MTFRQPFTKFLYYEQFTNYDATNPQEVWMITFIFMLDVILWYLVFYNFREITCWYYKNRDINPKRLICINFNLFLSVLFRLFDQFYCIVGWYWSDFDNIDTQKYMYFNVMIHSCNNQIYLSLQNIAICIAAKFWMNIISLKYEPEHQPLQLTLFQILVTAGWMLTAFSLIVTWTLDAFFLKDGLAGLMYQNILNQKKRQVTVYLGTTTSAIVFCVSCIIMYKNLEYFALSGLKQHARKVRNLGIMLGFFQVARVVFNLIVQINPNEVKEWKGGKGFSLTNLIIPDSPQTWSWVLVFYMFCCDFLPTLILLLLFVPNRSKFEISDEVQSATTYRTVPQDSGIINDHFAKK